MLPGMEKREHVLSCVQPKIETAATVTRDATAGLTIDWCIHTVRDSAVILCQWLNNGHLRPVTVTEGVATCNGVNRSEVITI